LKTGEKGLCVDKLPMRVEDITAEWVTGALSAKYPGTVVTSLHTGTIIEGTATKVRVLLNYNASGHAYGLPPTMWVKGGFIRHAHSYVESFVAETMFFSEWAPHLPINIPKAFYAATDPEGNQGIVLLEDLCARNVTFGYATRPITVRQQAATLDIIACLHAKWWQSPELNGIRDFSEKWKSAEYVIMRSLEPEYFRRCMNLPRGREVVGGYRDPDRVAAAMRAHWSHTEGVPHCFSHGDPHLGNMYFERDGSPGFLDWQAWVRAPYAHDVAYSIIGNLTIEDRRANERDLWNHYLSGLRRFGVANVPTFEDAWAAYRRHAIHGFMWTTCPIEMQPEEVSEAEGWRFGAAVADLDTFGALGV
jgi:hypothetical protein